MQYEEKYWIEVVSYVLKCISTVEAKLQAILVVIDAADVPWSETVWDIARQAFEYSHPLVSEISDRIESHPIYKILPKYQWANYKKKDVGCAWC